MVAHRKICALQAEQARDAMEASLRFAETPTVAPAGPTEPNGESGTGARAARAPSPAPLEEEDDEEEEMRMEEEDPFAGEWAGVAGDGGDAFSVRGRAASLM